MAVALNSNQVTELQNFLQNAQYADGYNYLRDIVNQQILGEGDFARSQDLAALSAWFDAAAHINANDGSFVSEFVRGSTESVTASQGTTVTDQQFQTASDTLAITLLTQIVQNGSIGTAQEVVRSDIRNAVDNLNMPDWGWAGAITDFLPPPAGLGQDVAGIPFDKWDDMSKATLNGLERAFNRMLQDNVISTFDEFLAQLPKDFIKYGLGLGNTIRGCKKFCVNGHKAGNCRHFERSRNDRSKSTTRRADRQPAVWI